jgi:hypothetical protein
LVCPSLQSPRWCTECIALAVRLSKTADLLS